MPNPEFSTSCATIAGSGAPKTGDETDRSAIQLTYPAAAAHAVPDETAELSTLNVVVSPLLFGRYRRLRELGRGGMGVVWLAYDEALGIEVALKLVPEEVARSAEDLENLRKEVLRGIALTHTGIVRVFSFERDATTTAIVMEYVDGESLADLKARQPNHCFEPIQLRPWIEQLCAILDYAHGEAKIAHRDLKPRNLMLTRDGRLKVADFGIASSLSETMVGVSIRHDSSGTPPYMSPQQAMGERPTSGDDIYSLGATMYDLLTGKPPFFRGNIIAQVLNEAPVWMEERRRELGVTDRAPIPAEWERAIGACLAKDPSERPPSGAALLALLDTPFHAPVPYAPRPCIPLETLRLDAPPAAQVPSPKPQREIIEVVAEPIVASSWRDGYLYAGLSAIGSIIVALGETALLWTRRAVVAAIVVACILLLYKMMSAMPHATARSETSAPAQAAEPPSAAAAPPAPSIVYVQAPPPPPPPPGWGPPGGGPPPGPPGPRGPR